MIKSFWRYSHLALAVSSFLFLLLASITGVILSAEPIIQSAKPYTTKNLAEINLSETIPVLKAEFPGITHITIENGKYVIVEGTDKDFENIKAYVNPKTGKILGQLDKKNEFFQWVTNLHRSLFLKETGRIFIGITAFFLVLIAISGIMLTIKRQRGIRRFLAKIPNDKTAQYYHVVIGRLSLIFILIIALSGVYLSLNTLGITKTVKSKVEVDFDKIKSIPEKNFKDFEVFKNIDLGQVHEIEFPFSDDAEDYYTLTLKDKELAVNQITGEVLAENKYPFSVLMTDLSMDLHTGRSNTLWAIILGISSLGIIFFIYSGFRITLKRISNKSKNKFTNVESNYILLVGSENGSTNRYANAVHKLLLKQGKKSFITSLNNYTIFPNAEHLLIFTSTYGLGEAPANGNRFVSLVENNPQNQHIHFSVIGFGSRSYADFCKFAFDIHNVLSAKGWANPLTDIHTVNDRSLDELSLWQESWSQQSGISFEGFSAFGKEKQKSLKKFSVLSKKDYGDTFLINIKGSRLKQVKSGDLLAIYPANDHRERLYSIGVVDKHILLSVKIHPNGLGSTFLHALQKDAILKARVVKNAHFNFPKNPSGIIMISNGTGIAPFLGMVDENVNQIPCHLYCGFKNHISFKPYGDFLNSKVQDSKLKELKVAYSREGDKQYVSHLIAFDEALIAQSFINNYVIMICGSLSMQKDVLAVLDQICKEKTAHGLSFYQSRNQILMDCY